MSDTTTAPMPMLEQLVLPAESCEGDVCVVPAHPFSGNAGMDVVEVGS